MLGLTPIPLYSIAFLGCTTLATGFGWWITGVRLDHSKESIVACQTKHEAFVSQVRVEGEKAERKTAEIIANQSQITEDIKNEYSQNLDRLRADYQRLRNTASRSPGSGNMPGISDPASRVEGSAKNDLPDPGRIVAECAEETLKLIWLQQWVSEQANKK